DRRNLLFDSRPAGQKRRQQSIYTSLEFLRGLRTEAEEIPQDGAENQQRDDVCAAHWNCRLPIADCRLATRQLTGRRLTSFSGSAFRCLLLLAPLAIG